MRKEMNTMTEEQRPRLPAGDADNPSSASGWPAIVLLGSEDTNAACALVVSVECPGHEPPRHRHQCEDEVCYVLEGSLIYYAGDRRFSAPAGSAIYLPRAIEHTFRVLTARARVLTMYTPGGFEGLLRELGSLAVTGLAEIELERLIATTARYGCEITGVPP